MCFLTPCVTLVLLSFLSCSAVCECIGRVCMLLCTVCVSVCSFCVCLCVVCVCRGIQVTL